VTATWKVTSVIGEAVLLDILDLISMGGVPGGPLVTREKSHATSMAELSNVILEVDGREEAKSHSSSWELFVAGAGFGGGFAAKEVVDC